jgi:syntaxin 16
LPIAVDSHISLHDPCHDRATAKLLGAALGSDAAGDIELGSSSGIGASYAPSWVTRSEKVKGEMTVLKERINKLKE